MFSSQELILIVVIFSALALIISNRFPPDVVALMVLVSLAFTGVVTPEAALSGFSSSVVITILGLFVITSALEETGIMQRVANRINALGRGSEPRLVAVFMLGGAALSLVMNNIAAGAMLLPAAVRVGRDSHVRLSRLLIPLSFGTLVGGMATYLTTANIVLSTLLEGRDLDGLGMMDFIPTGGLIVAAGTLYMLVVGRRLLPERDTLSQNLRSINLYETYQLDERLWELQVLPGSRLVDVTLREAAIGEKLGLTVAAIWHGHQAILSPEPDERIHCDDYLLVLGKRDRVDSLVEWGLAFREHKHNGNGKHTYNVDMTEVIIPPRSAAIGKSLTDMNFRRRFGLMAVAMWRDGRSFRTDVGKYPLQVGDALLMVGPQTRLDQLARESDYLVLSSGHNFQARYPHKAGWALLITVLVLLIAILDVLPLAQVMLAGMTALVVAGCLTMQDAYRAVEWRVIFLIAGMLPISIAMSDTGLAARIGQWMVDATAAYGDLALVAGLFVLTTIVTQIIGGQVTALVIGPIAISAALQVGVNPQAVAVAVAIGCSTAFLTPIAHPVNILMMGPAGYTFGDFFKVGAGITLVTFIALMLGMMLFWGI